MTAARNRTRDIAGTLRLLAAIVILWLTPVALLAGATLVRNSTEERAVSGTGPTIVPVGSRSITGSVNVNVDIKFLDPPVAYLRMPGLITAINDAAKGAPVQNGQWMVTVDGRRVISSTAPEPYYRPLVVGDRGTDVNQLNRLLREKELPFSASGDQFDHKTENGLLQLQHSLQLRATGTFEPSAVIWVGPHFGKVVSIAARVGQTISANDAILIGTPAATFARVTASEDAGGTAEFAKVPGRLSAGEQSFDVSPLGGPQPDVAGLANFLSSLEAKGLVAKAQPAGDGQSVSAGGNELFTGLTLSYRSPREFGAVASEAIVSSIDSNVSCIFVTQSDSEGGILAATPRKLADGLPSSPEIGVAYVQRQLIGDHAVVATGLLTKSQLASCK